MKILALECELVAARDDDMGALLAAEACAVWELQQRDVIREAYFRADRPLAVLVLEATSVAACREHLAELPLVRAGLIDFELVPLRAYPGFARLFAPAPSSAVGRRSDGQG